MLLHSRFNIPMYPNDDALSAEFVENGATGRFHLPRIKSREIE